MKRKLVILLAFLIGTCAFADVSTPKFFAGVYNFATEASDSWRIYDADFETINPVSDSYSFTGGFVVKFLGLTRYNFKCDIVKQGDDFSVKLSDVSSFVCDKNGIKKSTSSIAKTPENVAVQYAAQMKDEIKNRIDKITEEDARDFLVSYLLDENNSYSTGKNPGAFVDFLARNNLLNDEFLTNTSILIRIANNSATGDFASFLYDNKLTEKENVVNNTKVIAAVARNSSNELQFERYLTKTNLIGKKITLPIVFKKIDKSAALIGERSKYLVTAESASSVVFYATNNEDFIDYAPNKTTEITGTIKSIKSDGFTGVITIILVE